MSEYLDEIENKNKGNEPNISDINSYYPEGFTPAQSNSKESPFTNGMDLSDQVTSPGALSPQDYDPNAFSQQGNINKGSYSGSIVGNIPIFVDSHMISMAPYNAREQALQMAAAKKSKEIKQLTQDIYKVPQLKNAPDQPEMNDIYLNGIDKWKGMYNGDVVAMQKDPKFQAWQNDVKTAGRVNDAAFEQYAQMGKDMDEGKKYFSPETKENYHKFLGGLANLGDPANPDAQNFTAKAFKLNHSYDLDNKINDILSKRKPNVLETIESDAGKHRRIYDTITTTKEINKDREAIKKEAAQLYETDYKGTGTYTQKEIENRLLEALPYSVEKQSQMHNNQFAPSANSAPPTTYSYDQKEAVKNVGTVSRKDRGNTSFELTNVYKANATDQAKRVKFPIAQGLKYTDGTAVDIKNGYVEGSVSEIGAAKVYKPGVKLSIKVPGPIVKGVQTYNYETKDIGGRAVGSIDVKPGVDAGSPALYTIKPVAMFNVTENQSGVSGKNATNKTIVAPLSEVLGYYAKQGKKQGELDLTDMASDVEKQAKIQDNERLQQVINYSNGLKKEQNTSPAQKKSVPSENKGGLKPTGDL